MVLCLCVVLECMCAMCVCTCAMCSCSCVLQVLVQACTYAVYVHLLLFAAVHKRKTEGPTIPQLYEVMQHCRNKQLPSEREVSLLYVKVGDACSCSGSLAYLHFIWASSAWSGQAILMLSKSADPSLYFFML